MSSLHGEPTRAGKDQRGDARTACHYGPTLRRQARPPAIVDWVPHGPDPCVLGLGAGLAPTGLLQLHDAMAQLLGDE